LPIVCCSEQTTYALCASSLMPVPGTNVVGPDLLPTVSLLVSGS
jgi:hypothetical protein